MKMLIRLLIGLGALVVVAAAGALGWPYWPVLQDQFGSQRYRTWLADHRTDLDADTGASAIAFDDAVYDARFVMLSEIHGYRAVQAIDLALVSHFAETGPARTYLAELGPDQALAFNYFLETGDDLPARAVFDAWAEDTAQWANREFFSKLQALRALNASLPEARKVWFIGVDRIADADRLAALSPPASTRSRAGIDGYEAVQALNAELGARSLARREDASRYTHILENIEAAADLDRPRHFYGLWGLFHGAKTTVNGAAPLAMRLDGEGGAFENSVVTMTTICIDGCFNMMPARAMPAFLNPADEADYLHLPMSYDRPLMQRARGVNDIRAAMGEARISAFRVTGTDSPYAGGERLSALSGYLMLMQGFDYGGPAAEVTDYFVAMRGSAGLSPWRGAVRDVTGGDAEAAGIPAVAAVLD